MPSGRAPAVEYEIRPLRDHGDLAACVALQSETWGDAYADVVPASMLQVAAKMGGVVTGAFDEEGGLLGFVYGITGVRGGETAHWSHMLAVREDARDRGVGTALKNRQREELRAMGVGSVYWTFDPLVARNAHLNINRLGAEVQEYVPDFYGASKSELHELGTDRLVVKWSLDEAGGRVLPRDAAEVEAEAPAASRDGKDGAERRESAAASQPAASRPDGARPAASSPARQAEVLVPGDIDALRAASRDAALDWRRSSRKAFLSLLGAGYRVRAFQPGAEHARYVLAQDEG